MQEAHKELVSNQERDPQIPDQGETLDNEESSVYFLNVYSARATNQLPDLNEHVIDSGSDRHIMNDVSLTACKFFFPRGIIFC